MMNSKAVTRRKIITQPGQAGLSQDQIKQNANSRQSLLFQTVSIFIFCPCFFFSCGIFSNVLRLFIFIFLFPTDCDALRAVLISLSSFIPRAYHSSRGSTNIVEYTTNKVQRNYYNLCYKLSIYLSIVCLCIYLSIIYISFVYHYLSNLFAQLWKPISNQKVLIQAKKQYLIF